MLPSLLCSGLVAFLLGAAPVGAQTPTPAGFAGHWQGAIQTPRGQLQFEVDFAGAPSGGYVGTISIPAQRLKGLPLARVDADGRTIRFYARHDQTLDGELSADGGTIAGSFRVQGSNVPFSLARAGDARIDPPLRSARLGKALEGTWNGARQGDGVTLHLVLTMANAVDGGATARIVNLDEGDLAIPMVVAQDGSRVTLETPVVAGSFTGVMSADGAEIAGTWTEGSAAVPVTFRRDGTR